MASSLLPAFTVRRGEPVLVSPAEQTPRETKTLSDIDDGEGMRFYSSGIHLYRANPDKQGVDPAAVIREALARALVPYYPLAGRLREEAGRKLVVDCEAQGVMFVEADVDLTAADFGDVQSPPFPCFEQFILESTTVAGVESVIDRPLLYIQGDEAQVRGLHLRAALLPLRGGRAGRDAVREGRLRAGVRRRVAVDHAGVGQGDVHGEAAAAAVLPAPGVQRAGGRGGRPDADDSPGRHRARALLLRATRDRGAAAARAAAHEPELPVRAGGGVHLAGPHGGARLRRRRGGAAVLHRERARPPRRAAPGGLLRERVRLLRGGDHGRGALRGRAGLRAGAGEEGQVGRDVRLPAVGGGPDGAPRAAPVRAVADVHRVGREPRWVQERGLRVGRGGVRRAGQGRRGADPRRDQLLLQVQERQGRGGHRGAHQP
uniref:Uncharacterized protein n=1 Tax=Aegilops tauschii subsp. strangulata TaxID=200361 RepID=A0A453SM13_AEGTS